MFSLSLEAAGKPDVESWYTHWGVGLGYSHFSGDFNQINTQGEYRGSFGLDLVGFYATLGDNIGLGVIVNQNLVNMKDRGNSEDPIRILQYQTSLSMLYFFDRVPRSFFIRTDAGITHGLVKVKSMKLDREKPNTGFGFLIGSGYAFPLYDETNTVSLTLVYSLHYNRISPDDRNEMDFISNNFYMMIGGFF